MSKSFYFPYEMLDGPLNQLHNELDLLCYKIDTTVALMN